MGVIKLSRFNTFTLLQHFSIEYVYRRKAKKLITKITEIEEFQSHTQNEVIHMSNIIFCVKNLSTTTFSFII